MLWILRPAQHPELSSSRASGEASSQDRVCGQARPAEPRLRGFGDFPGLGQNEMVREKEKSAKFWASHPWAPTFASPLPLRLPPPLRATKWIGPKLDLAQIGQAKNKMAKVGFFRISVGSLLLGFWVWVFGVWVSWVQKI